jgi:hypothetical protein
MSVDLFPSRDAIYDASTDVTETAELMRTEPKVPVCVEEFSEVSDVTWRGAKDVLKCGYECLSY